MGLDLKLLVSRAYRSEGQRVMRRGDNSKTEFSVGSATLLSRADVVHSVAQIQRKSGGGLRGGKLSFSCDHYADCLVKVSGKSFTAQKGQRTPEEASKIEALRAKGAFESALEAFNMSGDKNDLRAAQKLALSVPQKAQLEHVFMRVAGFNKVFRLDEVIKNDGQSVAAAESTRLLGLMQNVNASVPITVNWKIEPSNGVLPLRYGTYNVEINVGVTVRTRRKTCALGICNSYDDAKDYTKRMTLALANKSWYRDSGAFDLSVRGSGNSSFFGAGTDVTVTEVAPVISIESVTLVP